MPHVHDDEVLDVLELRIAEERYALPLARVAEVSLRLPIHTVPELAPPLLGFVSYRGNAVPVVDMRQRLGYPPRRPRLWDHFVLARMACRREPRPGGALDRQSVCLTERNRAAASSARRDEGAGWVPAPEEVSAEQRSPAPQIRGFATEGKPIGALVILVVDRALGLSLVERSSIQAPPESAAHVAGVVPVHGGLLFIADLDAVLSLEEERAVDELLCSRVLANEPLSG